MAKTIRLKAMRIQTCGRTPRSTIVRWGLINVKKGGKITTSGRIVVSGGGKSRTVTASGTDPAGKKIHTTSVYDKQ
jgi:hypothetical protein